jgi:glucose/arabinose dehydrogenase
MATHGGKRRWRAASSFTLVLALVPLLLASCRVEPASLAVTTAVGGLDHPWDMAFLPGGGQMVLTERVGRIGIVVGGQRRVLATPGDVVAQGEGGMMGIAVDPAFASNRRIYTCLMSNRSGGLDVRIARWRLNEALTGLTDRVDILTGIPALPGGTHVGCRIRFGPDGYLWAGTGDATLGPAPQSRTLLAGKVLRITVNGHGAPGNAGGGFRAEVYTYGHRNLQGLAFAPDGRAYSVEHGPDRDDEVNRLVRGGNYGWDPVPPGDDSYDQSRPMTDLVKFPQARRPVWASGSPTIAPSGATFLTGSRWGGWDGVLAIAVLKGRELRVFGLNGEGTAVAQEWRRVTDVERLRSAVQGPDGLLYIATDANPGAVLRVTPP